MPVLLSRLRAHWPFLILLLVAIPLLLIRLPEVPHTWYDEGLNLTAVRTLAEKGAFALVASDGLRPSDPAIQTGPPFLIPLSWYYRLVGPDLALMRLPMVIISLLTLVALYGLACRLFGRQAAWLGILLLLALPGDTTGNYLLFSRQVLGEIPAILCLTLGLHLLLTAEKRRVQTLAVGLLFGLAIGIKSQVLVVLTATVGLWALYRIARHRQEWSTWALILLGMFMVYGLDMFWNSQMAGDSLAQNAAVLREGAFIHIIPFRALSNFRDIGLILRFALMLAPVGGVLFLRWRAPMSPPPRPNVQLVQSFLLVFVTLWAGWYAVVSIGWQRYAFIGLVYAVLFLGYLLARAAEWLIRQPVRRSWAYAGAGLLLVIATVGFQAQKLKEPDGEQFFAMLEFVQSQLPADAVILTWEWPFQFVTGGRYIYPPTSVVNAITAASFLGQPYDPTLFDALAACPEYIILGSFMVDRQVLTDALNLADPTPLFSAGVYQVYQIPKERLRRQPDGSCRRELVQVSAQAK